MQTRFISSIDKKLWGFVLNLQKTDIGTKFVNVLYDIGVANIWNLIVYEKERKNPTIEMIKARDYYSKQRSRLKRLSNLLADEKSKIVFRQCIKYRCTHDYRDRPYYNVRDQYFPKDIISIRNDEVFVDCGAYNGDTLHAFKKNSHNRYKKLIAFEPDEANISVMKKRIPDAVVVPAAVWDSNTEVKFLSGGGSSSRVDCESSSTNGMVVRTKAIDNVKECRDATFIKMDVEGSEYNALIGAQNTIKKNKPKLAICIYHSDEDMLRILELLDSWNLNYKFYVRHHAWKVAETVLYAVK